MLLVAGLAYFHYFGDKRLHDNAADAGVTVLSLLTSGGLVVDLPSYSVSLYGVELDLSEVEDLDALTDLLRDLTGDGPGPALLLLEEDDEHVAVVRVDGGAGSLDEARVFLSDRRAVQGSEVAAMLWEQSDSDGQEDDQDEAHGGTHERRKGGTQERKITPRLHACAPARLRSRTPALLYACAPG